MLDFGRHNDNSAAWLASFGGDARPQITDLANWRG
jgi:hypothetical protein